MSDEIDDLFIDAEEDDSGGGKELDGEISKNKWKVLIVDDEQGIHDITTLSLEGFVFDNKGVEFIQAYSGEQAKQLIKENSDVALILLDVVMETDDAGLEVVKYIRDVLSNHFVRIVLRTGQPGQAPEEDVILNYDINDYKEKSELTTRKLFTTLVSALRSYRDIVTIEANRVGLEKIVDASSSLFEVQSMTKFVSGVMTQLLSILCLSDNSMFFRFSAFLTDDNYYNPVILAGTGSYADKAGCKIKDIVDLQILEMIKSATKDRVNVFNNNRAIIYFQNKNKIASIIYIESDRKFNEWDIKYIEIFCSKVSIAFDNVYLYKKVNTIQKVTIESLASLAEYKDTDTGEHIHRVADMSKKIAQNMLDKGIFRDELCELFIEEIGLASILHDVGKVGIPEIILLKPGKLDDSEFEVMKTHTVIGGKILSKAAEKIDDTSYVFMAADIALNHHEKYDGTGYPGGLKRGEIPLSARIVAVVDVYDALVSKRPYKEPWPVKKAVDFIVSGSGTLFDPHVIDSFIEVI